LTDYVENVSQGGDADVLESVAAFRGLSMEELRESVLDVDHFVPDHERDIAVEGREDEELVEDRIADMAIRDQLEQQEVAREGEDLVNQQLAYMSDGWKLLPDVLRRAMRMELNHQRLELGQIRNAGLDVTQLKRRGDRQDRENG
jgi:hypothetical protein